MEKRQTLRIPSFKVILYGEFGSGKSSLFRRFLDDSFDPQTDGQFLLDFYARTFKVDEKTIELTLWDTGSMERVSTITSSYFRGTKAALLCYSLTNKRTFDVLCQHVLDIAMYCRAPNIFLCGTHLDEWYKDEGSNGESLQVTDTNIDNFLHQCQETICKSYKISNASGHGVKDMFESIAREMVESHMSTLSRDNDIITTGTTSTDKRGCRCL